ncbi:hypothetical protein DBIPINDM_005207 [Mesorhizobium sp. AR02]|uniref:hypothetical protein n=1 Tax=Mesorhizobium sp. AR02 TaxID=2865837 RepID=UPI0021604E64|nr:hypothetical protein [Mesorhizobium sp. AR02]UVK51884.1 hypothetical protein DBIPINDM_005207 [Mesorhizobium sp. AR02]
MPRYATIITDDDGREVVSAIGAFEGAAPQPRLGRIEPVAPGVLIGMVRDAGGGFCFPQPTIDSQSVGLVMARLRARTGAARPAGAAKPAGVTKPKRTKRARKKTARSKKPARSALPKAAASVGDADAPGRDNG